MKKLIISTTLLASAAPALLAGNADNFGQNDPIGWMMAVIAMSVVFSALVILFLSFKYLYPFCAWCGLKIMKSIHRKKQYEQITDRRQAKQQMKVKDAASGELVDDDELAAAIGVALFMHEDGMHDQESGVLTLATTNSTWTGAGQNQKRSPLRKF